MHRAAAPGARQAQLCSPGSQRARDTCCYVEPGGERHCAGAARGGGAPIVCTVIGSIAQKQMERRRDLPRAWPQEARRMTGTGSGMRSHSSRTWTRRVRRPSSCSAAAWCCGATRRRCGGVSRTAARTGARPPGAPTCCHLLGVLYSRSALPHGALPDMMSTLAGLVAASLCSCRVGTNDAVKPEWGSVKGWPPSVVAQPPSLTHA